MRLFFWLLISASLSGCGDPIGKAINKHFPPIDESAQRHAAVASTAKALSTLTTPNVAAVVNLKQLEPVLLTDDLRKAGVVSLVFKGDEQLVRARVAFKRSFDAADSEDPNTRAWLGRLKPAVEGSIEAYLGITGAIAGQDLSRPELQLRLLPGLSRIEVDRVQAGEKLDGTHAGKLIADVLNRYRDNITGALSRQAFTTVVIPGVGSKPIDPSKSFAVKSLGTNFTINVQALPVSPPVKLDGIAWLVTDDQVAALVQFSPTKAEPAKPVEVESKYSAIRHQVRNLLVDGFGVAEDDQATWAAVRKELIATTLNAAAAQANACVSVVGATRQRADIKIPMPSGDGIDCSSNESCEPSRTCTYSANKDERDCSACLLSRPVLCVPRVCAFGGCVGGGCTGGGCIQHGNEPTCELAKAAQNKIYEADANLRKAQCDASREAERVACQAGEVIKKGLCEAGKATLIAISRTGNFANIEVDTNVRSDNLQICLRDFNVSPGLDQVALALVVSGQAQADVNLKFTPLDIVGHLACQFPWSEKKTFAVSVLDPRIGVTSSMSLVTGSNQQPTLNFAIQPQAIKARVNPGPGEFLATSPNMAVACQGLNFLRPLVVTLTPFVKELQGEIEQKVDKIDASLEVPIQAMSLGREHIQLVVDQTPKSIIVRPLMPAASKG